MAIPKDVLSDLASRFLVSLPPEEREDPVRLCFQAERAHWFYIDNLSHYEKSGQCPRCNVRDFIRQIFQHCSFLKPYANDVDNILDQWREFKGIIPTYGAILIDESFEYVLLVQGFSAKSSWGFPKGKVNEEELPHHCAIREVKEETGFDISPLIDEKEYLERQIFETPNRLYLVAGVPRDYEFKPKTRNEIKECRWFLLDTLPNSRADNTKTDLGIYPNNFYMVFPYVDQLKKWISQRRGGCRNGNTKSSGNRRHNSSTTPTLSNGENYRQRYPSNQYHSFCESQQQQQYQPQSHSQSRNNRYSPRIRSASHSSPNFYYGDNRQIQSENRQKCAGTSSTKQQQQQQQQTKKNKKSTSSCKQKLDFDSSTGAESNAFPSTSTCSSLMTTKNDKLMKKSNTTKNVKLENSDAKLDVQPSKTWQQFQFNWEPIFSTM